MSAHGRKGQMTHRRAFQILGITGEESFSQIKKRYRQLMTAVHPDVSTDRRTEYGWNAIEINEAYAYLEKWYRSSGTDGLQQNGSAWEKSRDGNQTASQGYNTGDRQTAERGSWEKDRWSAPENPNAYAKREIFQDAENSMGESMGKFSIASGKYMWTLEEEFPLFLYSIYESAKQVLNKKEQETVRTVSDEKRQRYLGELVYLFAQQFTDSEQLLDQLAELEEETKAGRIYRISAVLETAGHPVRLKVGTALYPIGVRHHRLYLQTQEGKEIGYLSFPDDRLYYVIVPLFEQKRVQVKIRVDEKMRVQKVTLWVYLPDETVGYPENLQLMIENLLEEYL